MRDGEGLDVTDIGCLETDSQVKEYLRESSDEVICLLVQELRYLRDRVKKINRMLRRFTASK